MTTPLAAHISVFQGSTNTTPTETVPLSDMPAAHPGRDVPTAYSRTLRHLLATAGEGPV